MTDRKGWPPTSDQCPTTHSALAPSPLIPNRTAKRWRADDSTDSPCESRSSSGSLPPEPLFLLPPMLELPFVKLLLCRTTLDDLLQAVWENRSSPMPSSIASWAPPRSRATRRVRAVAAGATRTATAPLLALTPPLHPMPLRWTSTQTGCSIVAISPAPRTPTNACEHIEVYRPRAWCVSAPRWRNQGGWPTPRQAIVRPPHAHLTTPRSTRTSAPCACRNNALPMQTSLSCALSSSIRATRIHWRCSRMRASSAARGMVSIGCSASCDACSKIPLSCAGRSCHFHCSRCRCLRDISLR